MSDRYTTLNDFRLRHLKKKQHRLERLKWATKTNPKYVGVKTPPGKVVMVTCDTVADPWFISRKELDTNRAYYDSDPTIHVTILDKEEDNAGQEV
jgi:hypothetical protein